MRFEVLTGYMEDEVLDIVTYDGDTDVRNIPYRYRERPWMPGGESVMRDHIWAGVIDEIYDN